MVFVYKIDDHFATLRHHFGFQQEHTAYEAEVQSLKTQDRPPSYNYPALWPTWCKTCASESAQTTLLFYSLHLPSVLWLRWNVARKNSDMSKRGRIGWGHYGSLRAPDDRSNQILSSTPPSTNESTAHSKSKFISWNMHRGPESEGI